MGIVFGSNNDLEYYKGMFIDLGCNPAYALTLALDHLGLGKRALTDRDMRIKEYLLQGFYYATARSMAEEEFGRE